MSALQRLAGPEVIPGGTGREVERGRLLLREVGGGDGILCLPGIVAVPSALLVDLDSLLGRILCLQHGGNEDGGTEHVFVVQVEHLPVVGEVHHERTHECRLTVRHLPRGGVDVGQQGIAQVNHLLDGVIHRLALLAELVDFARSVRTVGTHHRGERAELQPADVKLLVERVPRGKTVVPALVVRAAEEAADVVVPVRHAAEREVQSGRDLIAQALPRRTDVARPHVSAVALRAHIARTRQDEHALVGGCRALVVIHALHAVEREGVAHPTERAEVGLLVEVGRLEVHVVRLRRVHPPRIHAVFEDALVEVLPVDVARFGRVGVVDTYPRRIFGVGRPAFRARGGPGLEVIEQTLRCQLAVRLRGGTE